MIAFVHVFATVRFEGFHRWPDAPEEVAFLRVLHRHIFHVRAEVEVRHDDRDVEFILLGRRVSESIRMIASSQDVSCWSCERWCREIIDWLGKLGIQLSRVEVSEDGENGAVVTSEVS
jgi:hypothetical protein